MSISPLPFPSSSMSELSSLLEHLAPDICRIMAGPRGEASTPLRMLLTRLAAVFDADDACLLCQQNGALVPAHLATSDRARRLARDLLEGRWFSRHVEQG